MQDNYHKINSIFRACATAALAHDKQHRHRCLSGLLLILLLIASMGLTACQSGNALKSGPDVSSLKEMPTETETESLSPEEAVARRLEAYADWPAYNWEHLTADAPFMAYEDENYRSELVVDLSKVQYEIDWQRLQEGGIRNCILKAGARGYSEGGLLEDSRFETHYQDAKAAGMNIVGVYFYSQAISVEEAEEEADFVLEKLKNCGASQDLIVFYDLETDISSSSGMRYRNFDLSNEEIRDNLDAFADCMTREGYVTGVYTNLKWHDRHLSRKLFRGYPLWIANYSDEPQIDEGFFLWQYTGVAHVKGSHQRVDLNLMFVRKES